MVPGVSAFISRCPDFIPCGEADDLFPFQTHRTHGLPPRIQTNLDENRCHTKCQPQAISCSTISSVAMNTSSISWPWATSWGQEGGHLWMVGTEFGAVAGLSGSGRLRLHCGGTDRTWEWGRESSKPRSLYWLLLRGAKPRSPGSL
jgi:hypothetical protein